MGRPKARKNSDWFSQSTLDEDNGLYKLVTPEESQDKTVLILEQIWFKQDAGTTPQEIADGIKGGVKKTIANNLTEIRKQKLAESKSKRWYLTKAGCKRLAVDLPEYNEEIQDFLQGKGKSIC